jgi:hypothetical protein
VTRLSDLPTGYLLNALRQNPTTIAFPWNLADWPGLDVPREAVVAEALPRGANPRDWGMDGDPVHRLKQARAQLQRYLDIALERIVPLRWTLGIFMIALSFHFFFNGHGR